MKKIVSVIVILAIGVFVIIKLRQPSGDSARKVAPNTFYSGAFTFKYIPLEKLGLAAKILNQEVTYTELTSRSPVLRDLTFAKFKLLASAADQKIKGLTKSAKKASIVLYMPKPNSKFNFDNSSSDFKITFSDQRPKNVIVKINETKYSREQIPLNQVKYSIVLTDIFEEKLRLLADIYTKKLLLKISKANNTTIQGYINRTILKTIHKVTDLEVTSFAVSKGIILDAKSAKLKNRLRNIIKENRTKASIEEFIKKNHSKELGFIYFNPPLLNIPLFENKAIIAPQKGKSGVPTYLVFSNLTCSSCSELAFNLDKLRKQYKNKIRIGFVNYFSDNNWRAQMAAEASLCLNLQSHDAFWDFFKKISKTKTELSEQIILETAKTTDVDYSTFSKCFVAQTYKKDVDKQNKYATDLGIEISPTVILGSRVFSGGVNIKQLVNTIESNL
jgi:predicted DsbA family dithiol-disulfide isomerase